MWNSNPRLSAYKYRPFPSAATSPLEAFTLLSICDEEIPVCKGQENHGPYFCHKCGWPFPDSHPSAGHKEVCGKIEGYKLSESKADNSTRSAVSNDKHRSDGDQRTPSRNGKKTSVKDVSNIGDGSYRSEDETLLKADAIGGLAENVRNEENLAGVCEGDKTICPVGGHTDHAIVTDITVHESKEDTFHEAPKDNTISSDVEALESARATGFNSKLNSVCDVDEPTGLLIDTDFNSRTVDNSHAVKHKGLLDFLAPYTLKDLEEENPLIEHPSPLSGPFPEAKLIAPLPVIDQEVPPEVVRISGGADAYCLVIKKYLKRSDIDSRFSFPKSFLQKESFLPNQTQNRMKEGKIEVVVKTTQGSYVIHMKQYLSGSNQSYVTVFNGRRWIDFVKKNNLSEDNEVELWLCSRQSSFEFVLLAV